MARKDEIFKCFLEHDLLKEKYGINQGEMPGSLREGLNSNVAIVKAIAKIVENLECPSPTIDKKIYETITQLLNISAI
jgi:hypothetical protein